MELPISLWCDFGTELPSRQVLQRILRIAILPNFEVQHGAVAIVLTHFGNFFTGFYCLTLGHQAFTVVGIGAQHAVTVLDNNHLPITDQPRTTVDDLSGRSSLDRLPFLAGDFNTIPGRVVGFEITENPTFDWPLPFRWIRSRNR